MDYKIEALTKEEAGYIGEQIDLSLTALNIGTLWYGFGKTKEKKR